jgi:hypothetical protein
VVEGLGLLDEFVVGVHVRCLPTVPLYWSMLWRPGCRQDPLGPALCQRRAP